MQAEQQKLGPILAVSCVLLIVILIILRDYLVPIGFVLLGLGIFAFLVILGSYIAQRWTDIIVRLHEQKLRQERLRPNDEGHYEIPLDERKILMPPQSNTKHREGQRSYYQGYDGYEPKDSSNRGWD